MREGGGCPEIAAVQEWQHDQRIAIESGALADIDGFGGTGVGLDRIAKIQLQRSQSVVDREQQLRLVDCLGVVAQRIAGINEAGGRVKARENARKNAGKAPAALAD